MSANVKDRIGSSLQNLDWLPHEDRQHLAGLTTVPGIQRWAKAKADEYRKFALALLSIHNFIAPVNRLPAEILELVFRMSASDMRLLHVCHRWRSILLDNPPLWTHALAAQWEFHGTRTIMRDETPYIADFLDRCSWNLPMVRISGFCQPIVQLLTPYIHSLSALQVTVDQDDLHNRLWPFLRAGMPALETLSIQIMITKQDLDHYSRRRLCWFHHDTPWWNMGELPIHSLPSLSRLTCPHKLLGQFNIPRLRHLTLQCWPIEIDINPPEMDVNMLVKHLARYDATLEVLEVMPVDLNNDNAGDSDSPETVTLSLLRELHLATETGVDARFLLSRLSFPPSTQCHFMDITHGRTMMPTKLFDADDFKLESTVGDIDHLHIQEFSRARRVVYHIRCYARDITHLHFDGFKDHIWSAFLPVFRDHAPIRRLTITSVRHVMRGFDLFAFPGLESLQLEAVDWDEVSLILRPTIVSFAGPVPQLPCPSLAKVVVSHDPGAPFSHPNTIAAFQEKLSVPRNVLAERASLGSRLRSFTLRIRKYGPGRGSMSSESSRAQVLTDITEMPPDVSSLEQSIILGLQEFVDDPVNIEIREVFN